MLNIERPTKDGQILPERPQDQSPIKKGEVFAPEIEVKKILNAPSQKRPQKLQEFI
jgi:hypothetical protein